MDIENLTPADIAEAVSGTVDRGGSVLTHCPIHEREGEHNPSLVITLRRGRLMLHCRSKNCDRDHFPEIVDHLVACGLPRAQIGVNKRMPVEIHYPYHYSDGTYAWSKIRSQTASGKKRFACRVLDPVTKQWTTGRPDGVPLLYNLHVVKVALERQPDLTLLLVEGEKDVNNVGQLGILASSHSDGSNRWRHEDTLALKSVGVQRVTICPDNDAVGIEHGVTVGKALQEAGLTVFWLELPGLNAKEDVSDWIPRQSAPDALLAELIAAAPPFDLAALDWRRRLKLAGEKSNSTFRGEKYNLVLSLSYEPRLRGLVAWNAFRERTEIIRRSPWCQDEWWALALLSPMGFRAITDEDYVGLSNFLVEHYDFGDAAPSVCRLAANAVARTHSFNELRTWLDTLPMWDKTARLNDWLANYAGADTRVHAPAYLAMVGSKFLLQVLHRGLNPGEQADYSLVFTSAKARKRIVYLERCFRLTTGKAFRTRKSVLPTSLEVSRGYSSRTPPKCPAGPKQMLTTGRRH